MQQLDIEYFFPLTQQIPLDLDFTESEKPKMWFTNSVLIADGGIEASIWAVPNTIQFHPDNQSAGYWQVGEGLQMHNKKRPNWLHQKMTDIFFGWKWKDK